MSKLVVLIVAIGRLLDLAVDRKDRTTKAYFDHETALMLDTKAAGIRNPLKVVTEGDLFRLVCGQTRLNAARRAGLQEVPVTVLQGEFTPSQLLIEELVDNNMTAGFDVLAQAEIYLELMRLNGWTTHVELCSNVPAAKPSAVTKALTTFSGLVEPLKARLRAGEFGPRLAYHLARLDRECQPATYERVKGLKVEAAEVVIGELLNGKPAKEKRSKVQDGPVRIEFPASSGWDIFKALGSKLLKAAARGEKGPVPPALVLQNLLKG